MATGRIKTWKQKEKFGFIKDDTGGDVYFKFKELKNTHRKSLKYDLRVENLKVEFEKRSSEKFPEDPTKFQAYNVRLLDPMPASTDDTHDSDYFHNPYTFIPTPPRDDAIKHKGFAGDFNPLECGRGLSHESLHKDRWTGHIPIKLTTVTPLVLPKTGGEERDSTKHQTYDVLDYIPESSLRGMLRSAYEVITNSRYSCFHNSDRLEYRVGRGKTKYEKSPEDLLPVSLKPAKVLEQLSPADRLFGWVPQTQGTDAGYKSRIRVICEDGQRPGIVQRFQDDQHLALTILGEPKPQQARFYVAKDKYGAPQCDNLSKEEAGYSEGKGLRGRKYYWHHKNLEFESATDEQERCYWRPSVEDRTQIKRKDRYQEYRRPDKCPDDDNPSGWQQKDGQNCSITGWIKPDTEFKASLYVQNLQPEEVGALLWLLTRPDKHYFRLGYGKPLGFGSVKMELNTDPLKHDCLPLGTMNDWKDYYAAFGKSPQAVLKKDERDKLTGQFKTQMVNAFDRSGTGDEGNTEHVEGRFAQLSFIKGFIRVLQGPGDNAPIHYPRRTSRPDPAGKNFNWFEDNEKGIKAALPAVDS